jgi:hypothetical protein
MIRRMFVPHEFSSSYGVNALLITASVALYCLVEPAAAAAIERVEKNWSRTVRGGLWDYWPDPWCMRVCCFSSSSSMT